MANRLLDGFSGWNGGSGGGSQPVMPVKGNRLASGFDEWNKKRKPAIDSVLASQEAERLKQEQIASQAPPISKPVDQVAWESKSLGQKTNEVMAGIPEAAGIVSKKIEDTLINKPADWLSKTSFIKDYATSVSSDQSSLGEEMLKKLSHGKEGITGATGGMVQFQNQPDSNDWLDKTLNVLSQGVGMAATLGAGTSAVSAATSKIPIVSGLITKYPTVGKYAKPILDNAISFAGFGQLNPELANDYLGRMKKAGLDAALSPAYTALGFIKDFRASVPAAFGLGFGMAKLDGASNEDALVSGAALSMLDLFGRQGGQSDKTLFTGKALDVTGHDTVTVKLKNEALSKINEFADTKITLNSTPEEINTAFKEGAQKVHPDKTGGDSAPMAGLVNSRDTLLGKLRVDSVPAEQEKPFEQKPQEQPIVKTETAPATEKAPNVASKSIDLLRALDNNDTATAAKLRDTISTDELQKTLKTLDIAEQQADPELKASIIPHKVFIQNALNERDTAVHETVGNAVLKDENKIDALPPVAREEAVAKLEELAKTSHEVAPKAEAIISTIKENNLVIDFQLSDLVDTKSELLAKKKEAETPEVKTEIQEKIDTVDKAKFKLRDAKNKADITEVNYIIGKGLPVSGESALSPQEVKDMIELRKIRDEAIKTAGDIIGKKMTIEKGAFEGVPITDQRGNPVTSPKVKAEIKAQEENKYTFEKYKPKYELDQVIPELGKIINIQIGRGDNLYYFGKKKWVSERVVFDAMNGNKSQKEKVAEKNPRSVVAREERYQAYKRKYAGAEKFLTEAGIPNVEKSMNWIKNVLGDGVKDEETIRKSINVLKDGQQNPNSQKAFEIVTGVKLPKTQKAAQVVLEEMAGLSAQEKRWLTEKEVKDFVLANIGEWVVIDDNKSDWKAGREARTSNPELNKLQEIDENLVVYTRGKGEFSRPISAIRDFVIDGKSLIGDKKNEEYAAPLFKKDTGQEQLAFSMKKSDSLTTKILSDLQGRDTVSKQYILDATNRGDIKQVERDLIREVLRGEGDTVNVKDFTDKVKMGLLPLSVIKGGESTGINNDFSFYPRYENVSLPDEQRGAVAKYDEHLYQSPVETSAGSVHYNEDAPNYFAHTRVEDMPVGKVKVTGKDIGGAPIYDIPSQADVTGGVRRIIEIQSDLFQKGNIEGERNDVVVTYKGKDINVTRNNDRTFESYTGVEDSGVAVWTGKDEARLKLSKEEYQKEILPQLQPALSDIKKLEPYRNIWHERIIREEVKQAAQDAKKKLLFPTGKTAMIIEGLAGQGNPNFLHYEDSRSLKASDIQFGQKFHDQRYRGNGSGNFVILDSTGTETFNAINLKHDAPDILQESNYGDFTKEYITVLKKYAKENKSLIENFSIAEKVDTENPIYRFYEKTVARYLKNRYDATFVTDKQGVTWNEIAITKDMATSPVEAFNLGNRATRGADGKFTGSLPDTITQSAVEKHISKGLALQYAKQVLKETNPAIASAIEIKIFEQLTYGKGDSEYELEGYYSSTKGLIALSENVPAKEFIPLARHEIRHTAFTMLPRKNQMEIEEWYIDLSEEERMRIYGYPGLYHDYLEKSKGNLAPMVDGSPQSPITFMADETFNRFMGQNEGGKRTPLQRLIDSMVSAIMRLLGKINKAIFKNASFAEKVRHRKLMDFYKNVFTQKTGDFVVPEGYLSLLKEKGFSAGRISFDEYIYTEQGAGFASEKKLATQSEILAKLFAERAQLTKEKRGMENSFMESNAGSELMVKNEMAIEASFEADPHVIQGIKNNPRFAKEGTIQDAMGSGWLMVKKDRYVVVESAKVETYMERGYQKTMEIDSLASAAGFEDGISFLEDQLQRVTPPSYATAVRRHLSYTSELYQNIADKIQKAQEQIKEAKDSKNAFYLGMRVGGQSMRTKFKEKMSEWKHRKEKVAAAQEFFGLSDGQFKAIGGNRNVQYLSNEEFTGFLNHIQSQAEKEVLRSNAREAVVAQIQQKNLRKVDNLRRALKLPTIPNMTTEQLRQYDQALEMAQPDDEFLTQRMIETLRLTELKGAQTVREVREVLNKKLGENFAKKGIKISPLLDRVRWDTALAESNPFMNLLVTEKDMAFLTADARTLDAEKKMDELVTKSRKSTKRSIGDILVPEDTQVFDYLESNNKPELARKMTTAQLELAVFMQGEFEKMRDYLIQNQQLKAYRENYVTHIRKDFFERWKNDGLYTAIKTIFEQQQIDEAAFEILSGETEEIIPFEKWFQFAMRRSDVIDPSKNVMNAFMAYKHVFERKVALDSLIPKIMTYVYSLTPSEMTEKGLVMDRSLRKFVVSWLNSKKGRKFDFGGVLRQGSKADTVLTALRSLTSILDLGLSIPIGIAQNAGEFSANFIHLGAKQYAKGLARGGALGLKAKKSKAILEKYKNFVGKAPWEQLSENSQNIGDRAMGTMFYLFHSAQIRANKHFFLGAITDAEYNAGEVTSERLAQMKIAMGRWRVVEGAKSIIGNTSLGGVATQYKTWGIVALRTTSKNLSTLIKNWKNPKEGFNSREGQETIRQAILLSTVGLLTLLALIDDKDKSFLAVVYKKTVRDALSSLQALNPLLYITDPRALKFLIDVSGDIAQILSMEEYKTSAPGYTKGDLKGVNALQKTLTPGLIKQFNGVINPAPVKNKYDLYTP